MENATFDNTHTIYYESEAHMKHDYIHTKYKAFTLLNFPNHYSFFSKPKS